MNRGLSLIHIFLVLDEGRLVQEGTHESLLQEDGLYRRVWEIQNAAQKEVSEA